VDAAGAGDEIELVLDRTPFYAEGGGQLADQGVIELANGAKLQVLDVQSPITGMVVHQVKVLDGEVTVGVAAHASVDTERRLSISRSHTATHMVHKAFREALGETATQAGSENSPGRFRFDFSATGAVPESVMADVEARVNELILDDLLVEAEYMTQKEAVASGAMALFGEKYGDEVRVISVGDWARELCGGTHTHNTGRLGLIKLLGESSIGSGVRRVEALVGSDAYQFLAREHVLVAQLAEQLKAVEHQGDEHTHEIIRRGEFRWGGQGLLQSGIRALAKVMQWSAVSRSNSSFHMVRYYGLIQGGEPSCPVPLALQGVGSCPNRWQ
jgi:alanyl-tRNA synthetase